MKIMLKVMTMPTTLQKKKTFTGSTVIFCQAAFKRIYKVHLKDYENKYFWKWTHYNFLYTFPAL